MSDEMKDERVIELLTSRNPAELDAVKADLADGDLERMRLHARQIGSAGDPTPPRRWSSLWKVAVPVVAVVAIVFVALAVFGSDGTAPGESQAFAAEAIRIAEGNPRYLVGADGWTVSFAGEFKADKGNTDFVNGEGDASQMTEKTFRIDWEPDRYYTETEVPKQGLGVWVDSKLPIACTLPVEPGEKKGDYQPGASIETVDGKVTQLKSVDCKLRTRVDEVDFLGQTVRVMESQQVIPGHDPITDFSIALPPTDGVYTYISAYGLDEVEFYEVLDSVYQADVEEWLSALPPDVVQTNDRPEIVAELLKGLPVHPDVDVDALKNDVGALDRYQLGAKVSGAVACAWLDQWADGVKTGDQDAIDEATEAMSDSRDWPVLKDMADEGGWSQVIWEYSKQMQDNDRKALLGSGGTETIDGKTYELSPSYATGLGCDSEKRVLRDE